MPLEAHPLYTPAGRNHSEAPLSSDFCREHTPVLLRRPFMLGWYTAPPTGPYYSCISGITIRGKGERKGGEEEGEGGQGGTDLAREGESREGGE